jgi:hypothetical protein
LPNLADCPIDAVVGVEEDAVTPDALNDLFAADELVSALDEEEQHLHGDAFQPERTARMAQFVGIQIQLEVLPEFDCFLRFDWLG